VGKGGKTAVSPSQKSAPHLAEETSKAVSDEKLPTKTTVDVVPNNAGGGADIPPTAAAVQEIASISIDVLNFKPIMPRKFYSTRKN
jgi:hypothetical protein